MATVDRSVEVSTSEARPASVLTRPADSLRFDLFAALLAAWFIAGMFLDGWAHNNGRLDNTFFTPWHLVLYSGYGAVGALLTFTHFRNVSKGYSWMRALPRGYMPALFGVLLFGFGGLFDFWWHDTFGFEVDTQALLSPAHLLLASGAILFISAPLFAAWQRPTQANGWKDLFPAILSLVWVLSLLTFFTQFSFFLTEPDVLAFAPRSNELFADVYGIVTMIVPTALIMGLMLFALRRWTLPFGTFTLLLTVDCTLMFFMRQRATHDYPLLLLVGPIGGIVADVLAWRLRPSAQNVLALRIFAFLVPFVMFLVYMFLLNLAASPRGLWWEIHMWLGVPIMTGITGFFLSFLIAPPAIPVEVS